MLIRPNSRAAEIEAERAQKASELAPDTPSRIEQYLNWIKQHKVLERLTNGVAGVRVHLGGLVTGSGFAAGPEYVRRDLFREQATFRASLRGSTRKFYLMDTEFSMPHLAGDHLFLDLYAVHRDYPHLDYYGPGPESAKSGRSGFTLEDTSFQVRTGVRPVRGLDIGVLGRYLLVNVGPGRDDRFVSSDLVYSEATTPGLFNQTNFLQSGAYVQFDSRDYPGEPRSGMLYYLQVSNYSDQKLHRSNFDRLEAEVQHYIPFFNQRRVIALRGRATLSDPHSGQIVPFYLQPTLGGSDDLRGFRTFRFYDNNSIILNAEYRWEAFSGLDMALFVDSGRVFRKWSQITLHDAETSAGFGFRFNVRNNVFMRIDTGFSREGFQVWFKFNNVF